MHLLKWVLYLRVKMLIKKTAAGIDPGSHGAISVIDNERNVLMLKEFSNNYEIIISRLKEAREHTDKIYLESAISVSTNRTVCNKLFFINGFITGIAYMLGFEVIHCNPAHWKKVLQLSSDKSESISMAINLFVKAKNDIIYSHDSYKDGLAESLLIAYYGMNYNQFYPEMSQLKDNKKKKEKDMQTKIKGA